MGNIRYCFLFIFCWTEKSEGILGKQGTVLSHELRTNMVIYKQQKSSGYNLLIGEHIPNRIIHQTEHDKESKVFNLTLTTTSQYDRTNVESIQTDLKYEEEKGDSYNVILTYSVGDKISVSCETNTSTNVQWMHVNGKNITLSSFIAKRDTEVAFKITLTMTQLDSNSSVFCIAYDKQMKPVITSKPVILFWDQISVNEALMSYGEDMKDCSHHETIVVLKGDKIVAAKQRKNLITNNDEAINYYKFRRIAYEIVDNNNYRRCVSKWCNNTNEKEVEQAKVQPKAPGLRPHNQTYFVAGGAAVAGLVICITIWVICRKNSPLRQRHVEVETYASANNAVQYVDLQTTSSTNTPARVIRDDTPYAQIIGVLEPPKQKLLK